MIANLLFKFALLGSISHAGLWVAVVVLLVVVLLLASPAGRTALRRDGPRLLRNAALIVLGVAAVGLALAASQG